MKSQSMLPMITYLIVLHACSSTAVTKSIGLLPFCLRCLGHLASSSCSMSEKGGLTAPGGERRRLAGGSLQQHLASVVAAVFPGLPPIGGNFNRTTNQPSAFAPTAPIRCTDSRASKDFQRHKSRVPAYILGTDNNVHNALLCSTNQPSNLWLSCPKQFDPRITRLHCSGVYRPCLATGLHQWCQSLRIKLRTHCFLLFPVEFDSQSQTAS